MDEELKSYVDREVNRSFIYCMIAILVIFIVFAILLFVLWWNTNQELEKKN